MLLLHGLTGNAWEWDPIAAVLSRRSRVLALNQRGHGASGWASNYAAERMVEDLAEFTAVLGLGSLAIVGHSMGGLNGYLFASRYPELVERLVIVDFGPSSMTPEAAHGWTGYLRAAEQTTYSDPLEVLADWQSANPRARESQLLHFIVHNLVQDDDGRWRWRFDSARLASFFEQMPDEAAQWAALRRLDIPTLLIRGEHSEVLSTRTAAQMAHELPGCRLLEIPDGAHDLTVERPDALTEAVDRFLSADQGVVSGHARIGRTRARARRAKVTPTPTAGPGARG